jgi:hypothetical protein
LKERYSFIDLLKPESEPLFALLLAVEPEARGELDRLAKLIRGVAKNLVPKPGFPVYLANVSASAAEATASAGEASALGALIATAVPASGGVPDAALTAGVVLTDVSAGSWLDSKIGLLRSFLARGEAALPARLPALRQAFRALEGDPTSSPAGVTSTLRASSPETRATGAATATSSSDTRTKPSAKIWSMKARST